MKKIVIIILLFIYQGYSQSKNGIFAKEPIINLENFKKPNFGFYLGSTLLISKLIIRNGPIF
jgi:hypothetical protein